MTTDGNNQACSVGDLWRRPLVDHLYAVATPQGKSCFEKKESGQILCFLTDSAGGKCPVFKVVATPVKGSSW